MKTRRAFTLLEAVLVVAIAALLIATLMTIYFSTNRMAHYGDLSAALQEGSLALALIQDDLSQAVQKPDRNVSGAVMVLPNAFQLLRAKLGPGGSISGELVVYKKMPNPSGGFRLKRQVGAAKAFIPGIFNEVQFEQFEGDGGPFVRMTLKVSAHASEATPGQPRKGSDEAILTTLVRVQGPEMVGSGGFAWSFMSSLLTIPFLSDLLNF